MFIRRALLKKSHFNFFKITTKAPDRLFHSNANINKALVNSGESANWVQKFFDNTYADCDMQWKLEDQNTIAAGVEKLLDLKSGMTAYDQCCGTGGLSLGLARRGIKMTGVDQSQSYIEKANALAKQEKLSAEFFCADAYTFSPTQPVNAGINWFSSLGYNGPEGAKKFLTQLHNAILPNGYWLVESTNVEWIRAHFKPYMCYAKQTKNGEQLIERKSHWEGDWLVQDWRITPVNHPKNIWEQKNTRCWHIPLNHFQSLVTTLGGKLVAVHADINENTFTKDSPRWLGIVKKP